MRYHHEVLRNARLLRGLNQRELAEATGLSAGAINMVELGKAPWLKAIRTISKYIKLDLSEVIITENVRRKSA